MFNGGLEGLMDLMGFNGGLVWVLTFKRDFWFSGGLMGFSGGLGV